MLSDIIKNWKGAVEIDGRKFDSVNDAVNVQIDFDNAATVILLSCKEHSAERENLRLDSSTDKMYRVTVKQYMTKPSSPSFDFMKVWNNDKPMPLRTMIGTIEKETRGMVYMNLHGDISSRVTQHCMKCGRPITNPVSQFFGMGPDCGGHSYVNPFESEEELKEMVENYRRNYLQKIVWSGWIIKSAIIEQEVVK